MPIDPVAKRLLDEAGASGRPNAHLLPVPTARDNFESSFRGLARPPVRRVVDLAVPTRDAQSIPGRLYLPAGPDTAPPLTVYLHGGGWLLGSIDTHDVTTRALANASSSAVLSVGYRRGPESRFPTAVDDAVDALVWAADPASGLPVDHDRVAVAGDSAGGNLAGAAALYARDAGAPRLRHQLLVYPVTTTDLERGVDPDYDGVVLERDELQWHQDNYLESPLQATDPRVNLLDADLAGLPETTVILAECDPIRPQGERFAAALDAAGVPVRTHLTPGLVHGFFGLTELYPSAAAAMVFAGDRLSAALRR
ncbi:alpha/beta hydrolase [Mycolicibacterium litorale]|uniref:Esterase n=1 Tax=Mycolicibacterium litorale TaxID=758802 RepID=A0AAD1IKJ9_9MYCO|nr:alpha/beta hydrolase [Mycolicibacterium litorale]MCV7415431.1 alpha/beta hydrolase [Mycolicibacterium litorale]TDY08686.1 acetyl esterase/lipase [Mycolicibacterium litorale]BBY16611.1 esterase [Mycolicibacterium litorale]